ncbi:MAG: ribonuclease III domain-containing protein [Clostridia bacterium]|nr:ribonuclease III domain-containing protein [Clostridia bacterium]
MNKNFLMPFKKINLTETSPLTLAYIGDAIHTLFIRQYLLQTTMIETAKKLHNTSTKFCSAKGQSEALDFLTPILDKEESEIVRRTRNQKNHNPPKSSDIEQYKKATCFEALVGYLWANDEENRLKDLLDLFMEFKLNNQDFRVIKKENI